MLEGITWKTYLIYMIILLVVYYLIIGILYYRGGIIDLIKGRGRVTKEPEVRSARASFDELEEVVEDIRANILLKAGDMVGKEELLGQLANRLTNYHGLREPAFRIALNHFIVEHAESICGVTFEEDELDERWATLPR